MGTITRHTRHESHESIRPHKPTREQAILQYLMDGREKTCREIMEGMNFKEPGQVRPRCTEMAGNGLLVAVGERKDPDTGKPNAIYKITEKGREYANRVAI